MNKLVMMMISMGIMCFSSVFAEEVIHACDCETSVEEAQPAPQEPQPAPQEAQPSQDAPAESPSEPDASSASNE